MGEVVSWFIETLGIQDMQRLTCLQVFNGNKNLQEEIS
jgi:hypothetical protein